jgi:hypothetical protein
VLEARLAELRAQIEGMGGVTEMGSAAFRCIACDRPIPTQDKWMAQREAQRRNALSRKAAGVRARASPQIVGLGLVRPAAAPARQPRGYRHGGPRAEPLGAPAGAARGGDARGLPDAEPEGQGPPRCGLLFNIVPLDT